MPKKSYLLPICCAVLCGCSTGPAAVRRGADAYPDVTTMLAAKVEGRDYSREVYDRGAPVTVFAVHGGDIELGTARLARRTAGRDMNLYIFNGWEGAESGNMHITAARFNDPAAVRLATSSVLGISLHAQVDSGSYVCVGGRNEAAARLVAMRLGAAGFPAETPCVRLPGTSNKNIVNLPSAGGVQLEITLRLLRSLERNADESARFAEALRLAVADSMRKIQQEGTAK